MSARPQTPPAIHRLLWFLKTPKGLLLAILLLFALLAIPGQGISDALPGVAAAMVTAALIDIVVTRATRREFEFPSGGLLTALIIALVLRPQEAVTVVILITAIAIGSKHLLRTRWSNIFNPAALALFASSLLFATGQSWWGALPDFGLAGFALLAGAGLFVADRINKLPLVIAFLGAYFAIFTGAGFLGHSSEVSEVFRSPDIQAVLFFAFFMLDDPPTCPIRYDDQIVFALIVAVVSFVIYIEIGGVYYLPAGLLAGNAWESARRQFTLKERKVRTGAYRDWALRASGAGAFIAGLLVLEFAMQATGSSGSGPPDGSATLSTNSLASSPAPSRSAVPTAAPTATVPTPGRSAPGSVTITSLTSPVTLGGFATLTAQTSPGALCSIVYKHPSGKVSTIMGLDPKAAGSDGGVSWTWQISTGTKPVGNGLVTVTCNNASVEATIVITQ
jgi:hypothetical protein